MPSHYNKHETHGQDYIEYSEKKKKEEERKKKKKRKYSTNKSTDDFIKKLKESGEW